MSPQVERGIPALSAPLPPGIARRSLVSPTGTMSARNSYIPIDSMSASNLHAVKNRCKYNTLTHADARRVKSAMNGGRPPIRTASVLHRPRAPPTILTNDDADADAEDEQQANDLMTKSQSPPHGVLQPTLSRIVSGVPTLGAQRRSSFRSTSNASNYKQYQQQLQQRRAQQQQQQHLKPSMTISSTSGESSGSSQGSPVNINKQHRDSEQDGAYNTMIAASPNNSESNLSYRSSVDVVDSAYGSDRLKTTSVDLGNPNFQPQNHSPDSGDYREKLFMATYNCPKTHCDRTSREDTLFEDSFKSACSNGASKHMTNQHGTHNTNKFKSLSKASLSASTTRVFQNQLFNIKRFFKNMPFTGSTLSNNANANANETCETEMNARSVSKTETLPANVSRARLDRSLSPIACAPPPPPPEEPKVISYMQNAYNYPNYDAFTRDRNRQSSTLLSSLPPNPRGSAFRFSYAQPHAIEYVSVFECLYILIVFAHTIY